MALRVNPTLLAVAAGIATLFAIPNTRWIVRNQVDLLMGRQAGNVFGLSSSGYGTVPKAVEEPGGWRPEDRKGMLGKAIGMVSHNSPKRFGPFRDYVRRHPNDAAARAIYACTASSGIGTSVQNVLEGKEPNASAIPYAQEVLLATEGAERLEPDNALFPALRASAFLTLGQKEEARKAFQEAAGKPDFNDYFIESAHAEIQAYESTHGYRGQTARMALLAGTMLPHYSLMKPLARWAIEDRGIEGRKDAMRFGEMLIRRSDVLIGVLVGRAIVAISLMESASTRYPKIKYGQMLQQARALDQDETFFEPVVTRLEPILRNPKAQEFVDGHDPTPLLAAPRTFIGAAGLLMAALALPLLGIRRIGRLKTDSVRFAAAAPHLAWLIALAVPYGFGVPLVGIGMLLLIANLLAPIPWLKYVRWAGYGLVGVTALAAVGLEPLLISPIFAFLLADWLSHRPLKGRVGPVLTGIVELLVMLALPVYLTAEILRPDPQLVPQVLFGLATVVAFSPRSRVLPKWPATVAIVIGGLLVLVSVGWELRDDRALAVMVDAWSNEAEGFRALNGLAD